MRATVFLALVFLFSAFAFAQEDASPTPTQQVITYNAVNSEISGTGFAFLSHQTAPLGIAILVLLAFGIILENFVKAK